MPKRSSKPRDLNALALAIVQEATGEEQLATEQPEKNPAAVALGKLGGMKGGRARADKMTPERRKQIALKAAHARWAKRSESRD